MGKEMFDTIFQSSWEKVLEERTIIEDPKVEAYRRLNKKKKVRIGLVVCISASLSIVLLLAIFIFFFRR